MTRLPSLGLVAALLALHAVAAQAQDAEGDQFGRAEFEIAGVAQPACLVGQASAQDIANASFAADGVSGGTLSITALSDPDTAQGNAASAVVTVPVICNAAHKVTIGSGNGGLLRDGGTRTALGGFEQFLPYQVNYNWAGQDVAGTSDAASGLDLSVPSPGRGDLTVSISLDATDAPLVAGSYEDVLLIEVSAAN